MLTIFFLMIVVALARRQMRWGLYGHQFRNAQSMGLKALDSRWDVRGMATPVDKASPENPSKPKPKAATPLRRSAAKSLPIRANPTPTRSDIQTVFTLATAERYSLSHMRGFLPPQSQILYESWWVPKWGEKGNEGEIFVFANGSFVCWGLGEDDAKIFADKVLSKPNMQVGSLKEAETEELEFVTDPNELGKVHEQYRSVRV
jgi:required for meiotic nuclear division protein 1